MRRNEKIRAIVNENKRSGKRIEKLQIYVLERYRAKDEAEQVKQELLIDYGQKRDENRRLNLKHFCRKIKAHKGMKGKQVRSIKNEQGEIGEL